MRTATPGRAAGRPLRCAALLRLWAIRFRRYEHRSAMLWSLALLWLTADLLVRQTPWTWHPSLDPSHDGAYYIGIARHVRDGRGLVTDVSLMHKGYPDFPHPTSVYPLWPLLLGFAARLIPIQHAATILPAVLTAASVVLAHEVGRRVVPGPLCPALLPGLHGGHLLAVVVGLHRAYFAHGSFPYTEPLAYTILFAALLRLWSLRNRPGLRAGVELGIWCALALLARSQLVLLPAAFGAAAAVVTTTGPERRRHAALLLGLCLGFVPLAAAYLAHLRGFLPDAGPSALLRFDQNRPSNLLSPIPMLQETSGWWAYLADRARGVPVAFSPTSKYGFQDAYHGFQYALPLAAAAYLLDGDARRRLWSALGAWHGRQGAFAALALLLLAASGYASLHHIHKATYLEWNFHTRHGLSAALAFAGALAALLAHPRAAAALLGVAIFTGSTALGYVSAARTAQKVASKHPKRWYRHGLVKFLRAEHEAAGGHLVVAMLGPHEISLYTRGVGYHAIVRKRTTVDDLLALVRERDVRYVIVPDDRGDWPRPGPSGVRFRDSFEQIKRFGRTLVFRPGAGAISPSPRETDAPPPRAPVGRTDAQEEPPGTPPGDAAFPESQETFGVPLDVGEPTDVGDDGGDEAAALLEPDDADERGENATPAEDEAPPPHRPPPLPQ